MAAPMTPSTTPAALASSRPAAAAVCAALLLLVAAVFGQTASHGFVNFDDPFFVTDNPHIAKGLTPESLRWAFTAELTPVEQNSDYWRPLSLLSHALDVQFFGMQAGGPHLVNAAMHALTAAALFLVLRAMTGAFWRSACVAALFAVHPLHVESVAWISERKDILCSLFFVLALGAYARQGRLLRESPGASRWRGFLPLLLCSALAMMSKPTAVVLPAALLLLDFWPLRRTQGERALPWRSLLIGKLPLFALALALAWVTYHGSGGVSPEMMNSVSLPWRVGNALVAVAAYLRQMVWPTGLAVFYPHTGTLLPLGKIVVSLLLVTLLTAAVLRQRGRRPYLLFGWLWFLLLLLPVLGIVQGGGQARADRYTYLSLIGPFVAITWLVADWAGGVGWRRLLAASVAVASLATLSFAAYRQTARWKDSVTLWTAALAVTGENPRALNGLGSALLEQGDSQRAEPLLRRALALSPDFPEALNNLGGLLSQTGRSGEALPLLRRALRLDPGNAAACFNLGNALLRQGEFPEAVAEFSRAIALRPDHARAENNLGIALQQQGFVTEASAHYRRAVELRPDYAAALNNLGYTLLRQGKTGEALPALRRAVELTPDSAEARHNLGQALLRSGDSVGGLAELACAVRLDPSRVPYRDSLAWALLASPDPSLRNSGQALALVSETARLSGGQDPKTLRLLAAVQAATGSFPKALVTARVALALARRLGDARLSDLLQQDIARYGKGALADPPPPDL